jgi:hypothetical protein
MSKHARVKADVVGCLQHPDDPLVFVELDPHATFPADDPLVAAHPDAFDLVDDTPTPNAAPAAKTSKAK